MTIQEEMQLALFNPDVIQRVQSLFSENKEILPIDLPNMSCRLFKSKRGNINIETQSRITLPQENYQQKNLGEVDFHKTVVFFKPFGFYSKTPTGELIVNILNEFSREYENLKASNKFHINLLTKKLSLEENAVIAAFSQETFSYANLIFEELLEKGFVPEFVDGRMIPGNLRYDKKLTSNGMDCELLMSFDGYPQFFLDDKYGFGGQAIGAYLKKDLKNKTIDICPTLPFKDLFDKLHLMGLLTAFK